MHGGEVTVSVGEGRVDGDGFVVASNGGSRISDFFKSVAQIRISIGESGLNTNGFAIMLQRLVKTPLLLQHRGQVAVGSREFGVYLEGLFVKTDGFRNFSALTLDVSLGERKIGQGGEERVERKAPSVIEGGGLRRSWGGIRLRS